MFGIFKKTTKLEKLEKEYKKHLENAFKLSKFNRSASDDKQLEAQKVLEKIEKLKNLNS